MLVFGHGASMQLSSNGQVRKEFECMQWRTISPPQARLVPPSSRRCFQDSFRATWCSAATLPHYFYFFQCLGKQASYGWPTGALHSQLYHNRAALSCLGSMSSMSR